MNIFKDRCLDNTPVKLASASNIIGFSFTYGGYEGMLLAAREALDGYDNACTTRADDALTVTRLAAMMLAIPAHEVIRSLSEGASPMTLSRADDWNSRSWNRKLYSHNNWDNDDGYERAHWNPGVGIWQIDDTFTTELNHAERANTAIGGLLVAKHLRDGYCRGRTSAASHTQLKEALRNWAGCRKLEKITEGETEVDIIIHKCYETYMKIFVPGVNSESEPKPEALRVIQNNGSDIDGGVQDRSCRWGPSGKVFNCYLYNVDKSAGFREGDMIDYGQPKGNGKGRPTPLAAPFISFTDPYTDIRYAVFPRSTALYGIHDKTIIKAAATDTNARDSKLGPNNNGWYNNTVNGKALYVNCRISDLTRLGPLCIWENANDES